MQLQQEHDVFLIGARTKPNLTRLNKITVRPETSSFFKLTIMTLFLTLYIHEQSAAIQMV